MNFTENHSFTRFSIYDQGHLFFTSLDRHESLLQYNLVVDLRIKYVSDYLNYKISQNDTNIFLKQEICDLKGYVLSSSNITPNRNIPHNIITHNNNQNPYALDCMYECCSSMNNSNLPNNFHNVHNVHNVHNIQNVHNIPSNIHPNI